MEQLIKFKENMQLGEHKKNPIEQKKTQSHNKYHIQTYDNRGGSRALATSFEKTSNIEGFNSKQDKKSLIYPYRNNNMDKTGSDKSMDKATKPSKSSEPACIKSNSNDYPPPMEEITERESENMTSARNRIY